MTHRNDPSLKRAPQALLPSHDLERAPRRFKHFFGIQVFRDQARYLPFALTFAALWYSFVVGMESADPLTKRSVEPEGLSELSLPKVFAQPVDDISDFPLGNFPRISHGHAAPDPFKSQSAVRSDDFD